MGTATKKLSAIPAKRGSAPLSNWKMGVAKIGSPMAITATQSTPKVTAATGRNAKAAIDQTVFVFSCI